MHECGEDEGGDVISEVTDDGENIPEVRDEVGNNGNQDDAADFYYTALAFGDDGDEIAVRGELAFLTLQMQRVLKEPTPDGVRDLFARYQLPFGFHPMHAQLAQILLEQAQEMNAGDLQQQAEMILREVSPQ